MVTTYPWLKMISEREVRKIKIEHGLSHVVVPRHLCDRNDSGAHVVAPLFARRS